MLYGAIGFYFGIDLPGSLAKRVGPTRPERWSFRADAVVIASAAGTFLAASAAFLSLGVIVLDGTMRGEFSVFVACSWAIGTLADAFHAFADAEKLARVVPNEKIESNGFNLNISRYVQTGADAEAVDVAAEVVKRDAIPKPPKMKDEILGRFQRHFSIEELYAKHLIYV
jgi:hypothetical protein